jgi:hypothetical protein
MSETTRLIHDIVDLSLEGTAFYEEAAKAVDDEVLCDAFSQMAKAKAELVDHLNAEIRPWKTQRPTPEALEAPSETYAEGLGHFDDMKAGTLTAIEQSERIVQQSLKRIVSDRDNTCVLRIHVKQHIDETEEFANRLRRYVRNLPPG